MRRSAPLVIARFAPRPDQRHEGADHSRGALMQVGRQPGEHLRPGVDQDELALDRLKERVPLGLPLRRVRGKWLHPVQREAAPGLRGRLRARALALGEQAPVFQTDPGEHKRRRDAVGEMLE